MRAIVNYIIILVLSLALILISTTLTSNASKTAIKTGHSLKSLVDSIDWRRRIIFLNILLNISLFFRFPNLNAAFLIEPSSIRILSNSTSLFDNNNSSFFSIPILAISIGFFSKPCQAKSSLGIGFSYGLNSNSI